MRSFKEFLPLWSYFFTEAIFRSKERTNYADADTNTKKYLLISGV